MQQHQMQQAMANLMDSCVVRGAMAGVGGYGLGAAFGLFMSSADFNNSPEFLKQSTKEQVKQTFKDMAKRGHSSGRNFGTVGLLFASSECVIESVI